MKPDFSMLFFIAGFSVVLFQPQENLTGDSDLFVHIAYGRHILQQGPWLNEPVLLFTDAPAILHEWLFEALMARLDNIAGLWGPLLFGALAVGSLLAHGFQTMSRVKGNYLKAVIYTVLLFFSLIPHLGVRPHLVSWLLVAWLCHQLSTATTTKGEMIKRSAGIVVLMAVWANLHGGFLLGLLIVGLEWACIIKTPREKFYIKSFITVTMALLLVFAVAATFANPWGYRLHLHLFSFLTDKFIISHTSDFRPPSLQNRTAFVFAIILVAVWLPLLYFWRHVAAKDWILVTLCSLAAMFSVRNIPYMGIIGLPVAANYLSTGVPFNKTLPAWSGGDSGNKSNQQKWTMRILWRIALVAGAVAAAVVLHGKSANLLSGQNVPSHALNWIATHESICHQPIFSDFMFSGFLLYETPVKKVYLHSLNAVVPRERLQIWLNVASQHPGWEDEITHLKWAFLKRGSPQEKACYESQRWVPRFVDSQAAIFENTQWMSRNPSLPRSADDA